MHEPFTLREAPPAEPQPKPLRSAFDNIRVALRHPELMGELIGALKAEEYVTAEGLRVTVSEPEPRKAEELPRGVVEFLNKTFSIATAARLGKFARLLLAEARKQAEEEIRADGDLRVSTCRAAVENCCARIADERIAVAVKHGALK